MKTVKCPYQKLCDSSKNIAATRQIREWQTRTSSSIYVTSQGEREATTLIIICVQRFNFCSFSIAKGGGGCYWEVRRTRKEVRPRYHSQHIGHTKSKLEVTRIKGLDQQIFCLPGYDLIYSLKIQSRHSALHFHLSELKCFVTPPCLNSTPTRHSCVTAW